MNSSRKKKFLNIITVYKYFQYFDISREKNEQLRLDVCSCQHLNFKKRDSCHYCRFPKFGGDANIGTS